MKIDLNRPETYLNPDLAVEQDNKVNWYLAHNRRHSFHHFNEIYRYGLTFRSARVMALTPNEDSRIGKIPAVRELIANPWFSALCVIREGEILFERYARDFGPNQVHSIQSINKTMVNLLMGNLVMEGKIDLNSQMVDYFPELEEGYGGNTIQQALNMDLQNDYSEYFDDPNSLVYAHERSMGWRIPEDIDSHESNFEFLQGIKRTKAIGKKGYANYKSSNTDILAMIIEKATGVPLRNHIANIIDAAGIEGQYSISCDRGGFPALNGGGVFTARDLARYGSLFTRGGVGVGGEKIGNREWMETTLRGGIKWSDNYEETPPYEFFRYSNQTETDRRALAHAGHCGQYLFMDMLSGVVNRTFQRR